jgi:hypothetical protein
VPQRERRPLERAEGRQRSLDAPLNLGALGLSLGVRQIGGRQLQRLVQAVSARLIVPGLFRSHQIHRAIRDDAIEPRAEVRPRFEAPQLLVGA